MTRKAQSILVAAAGVLLAAVAWAAPAPGPRHRVENSMVLDGFIDINPDGSVNAYSLLQPEKVPPAVTGLVAKVVPRWQFAPVMVDGKAVLARARMHLRLVADELDDGRYRIGIRSAWFDDQAGAPEGWVASKTRPAPRYPKAALRSGVTGTAYVVLRVARDGKVAEATVERVNLRMIAQERIMQEARELLGDASLAALRRWTFTVHPGSAPEETQYWDVRVPVTFRLDDGRVAGYGEWDSYVPGPYTRAPWLEDTVDTSSDALADGGVYPVDGGPHLLTRLGPAG